MIFIAESGSTKCDCVFLSRSKKAVSTETMGLNPHFHDSHTIADTLRSNPVIATNSKSVEEVFYYGTGCSTEVLNEIVKAGLQNVFPNATIHLTHDLMASTLATYEGQPVISCILGTGSNAVYYNGHKIIKGNGGLGFVLGDEGSGAHIGKELIRSFLYKSMPDELSSAFYSRYKLEREDFIESTLQKPHVNRFLSGFAPFAVEHASHPFIYTLVKDCLTEFIDLHVLHFKNHFPAQVSFVGSIAWFFKDIIEELLEERGLEKGIIVRKPLEGLVRYHLEKLDSK